MSRLQHDEVEAATRQCDVLDARERGQLVTRILAVNGRERTFVFDWGALPEQNAGVLAAPECHFHASPDGVRVEFKTATPRRTEFEGRPAFESDFPEVLYYMQRREYFRVDTPVLEPCICRGDLPSGGAGMSPNPSFISPW